MADIEQMLVSWLGVQFPSARLCTETPGDPEFGSVLPIVRVARIGGPTRYAIDTATVSVECFAVGRSAAKVLAFNVRDALYRTLPGTTIAGGVVGHVATFSAPSWASWDNTNVRRMTAMYQIHFKAV
jgi:hypothetical protein